MGDASIADQGFASVVETSRLRSLTGQCALILRDTVEFVIDIKEALRESAKLMLPVSVQLRLEQLEKVTGGSDSLSKGNEVDPLRSSGEGWKRELGNGVEYDRVLTGAVKFTL